MRNIFLIIEEFQSVLEVFREGRVMILSEMSLIELVGILSDNVELRLNCIVDCCGWFLVQERVELMIRDRGN